MKGDFGMNGIIGRIVGLFRRRRRGVYYVGGAEGLPPPMGKEEAEKCLAQLRAGDGSVRQKLIERNLRLVVYVAKRFENTGVGLEDLISIGTIGLIKAVETFDPEKRIKLATYATRCIENEILMFLRKLSNQKGEISLEEPINTDYDGNELLLSEVLGTDADSVMQPLEEETDRAILYRAVEKLPGREKKIIQLRFGLFGGREQTQKEVADSLGISQSYISRLEKRIISRLRHEILQEIG